MTNKELLTDPSLREIRMRVAKWYGKRHGYRGNQGGWISDASGRTICQGWSVLYDRIKRSGELAKLLDELSEPPHTDSCVRRNGCACRSCGRNKHSPDCGCMPWQR